VELGTVGIWSGGLRGHSDAGEVREAAAEVEELGYSALFVPGRAGGDDLFTRIDDILGATSSVQVATGILNLWMHEPADVVAEFGRLEQRHPGRFQLGLGISHAPLVDRSTEPGRYGKPLATMRRYLDELGDGVPPSRMLLAALAPKMLELARERTAGSHPYFVPVEHTRYARSVLGPDAVLAVEQTVLLEPDPAAARETARAFMATYLNLPNYVNNLLRHGFVESDFEHGGSDRVVDAIVAWGDEDAIAGRVAAHHEAGADHVCIQVLGPRAQGMALEEWRRLAPHR
jgi:probable F420-dependent oxidoreductase